MGVYDIFRLEIECPKCGNEFEIWAQTKSTHCEMKDYGIGDPIDWPNDEIFVYDGCRKCHKELYIGVRIENGFVKEVTDIFVRGELPGGIDDWFGKLYFPSDVAEYLKSYRYEQHIKGENNGTDDGNA